MSHVKDPSDNFTAAQEGSAHKTLAITSGILAVVFIACAILKVDTMMGPFMWYAFAIATVAATGVFSLMLKIDSERKAKSH